jgi:hypothetical protein
MAPHVAGLGMGGQDKTVNMGRDKFISQHETIDSELKERTLGLVRLEDFQWVALCFCWCFEGLCTGRSAAFR